MKSITSDEPATLWVVGIGPGDANHLTLRALEVIRDADVIVGYSIYLDQLGHLIDDKEVVRSAMGQEAERAAEAIRRAPGTEKVVLISGGDPGIYGIAGPVLQQYLRLDQDQRDRLKIEIVPGVTAASMAAALVGAPLMEDFGILSLSDRFVPWSTICRRLSLLLEADMVVVLYEPASRLRPGHMTAASKIISAYRHPGTPVAVIRDASRPEQQVSLTTVEKLPEHDFDMHTVVIVGSGKTIAQHGIMLTRRAPIGTAQDIGELLA